MAAETRREGFGATRNLTVLISGNGTNLQALMDACGSPALPKARIVEVISK